MRELKIITTKGEKNMHLLYDAQEQELKGLYVENINTHMQHALLLSQTCFWMTQASVNMLLSPMYTAHYVLCANQ